MKIKILRIIVFFIVLAGILSFLAFNKRTQNLIKAQKGTLEQYTEGVLYNLIENGVVAASIEDIGFDTAKGNHLDEWDQKIIYEYDYHTILMTSKGPDKKLGTDDDIVYIHNIDFDIIKHNYRFSQRHFNNIKKVELLTIQILSD